VTAAAQCCYSFDFGSSADEPRNKDFFALRPPVPKYIGLKTLDPPSRWLE
jgi:hypothetical protein